MKRGKKIEFMGALLHAGTSLGPSGRAWRWKEQDRGPAFKQEFTTWQAKPKRLGVPEGVMCDKSCVRQGSQRSRASGVQKGEGARLQEDSMAPVGLGQGEGSEKRSHDLRAL